MHRKAESGSQLLARLISRTDLSCIDPLIFGKATNPTSSKELSPNHGKIIELYGSEGVGKSELALSLIAKVCLPSHWKGHFLNGQSSKVVFIDTEYKFSVLRLAIIIEQIVLQYMDKQKTSKSARDQTDVAREPNNSSNVPQLIPTRSSKNCLLKHHEAVTTDTKAEMISCKYQTCAKSLNFDRRLEFPVQTESNNIQDQLLLVSNGAQKEDSSSISHIPSGLTAEDIEEIVHDSLGRLQVLRVCCTQELTATLFSLSAIFSKDPLLSLVVIDTISAYYWIDKMLSTDNAHCTENNMAPIANIITQQVSEFGVTYLVVKSSLIGQKRKWAQDTDAGSGEGKIEFSAGRTDTGSFNHVEFLGRSWSRLGVRRIILSQRTESGKKQIVAFCSEWQQERTYTFTDDLLQL
ncbi:hypothetical protein Btru_013532 [Bulinus truncatus]|nr:hypothetical protein Btru_013532 [Bulinus truncatus]